jgi:hypothetical protein
MNIYLKYIVYFVIFAIISIEVCLWYYAYYIVPDLKTNELDNFINGIINLQISGLVDENSILSAVYVLDKDINVLGKKIDDLSENDKIIYNRYKKLSQVFKDYDNQTEMIHSYPIPRYNRYLIEGLISFVILSVIYIQ